METLLNIVAPDPANATGAMLFAAIFFTFMFMFFLVLGVTGAASRRSVIRNRIFLDRAVKADGGAPEQEWEVMTRSLRFQSIAGSSALLANVERGAKSKPKESEKTKLQRELVEAGFFGPGAAFRFQVIRLALTAALPVVASLLLTHFAIQPQHATRSAVLAALAGIGFLLPGRYLVRRRRILQQQCRGGFPDFMDLMVVCTEAGLSSRAAIDRIAREMAQTYPYLGANLYLMSLELRAGATLAEAVANLARRINLDEVHSLGSLLQQTEQLGASIGEALRVYSDEMRDKRLSRAEEKAHALPVKLVIPLGIYVFPVMLVVIALPVFLRIKNALFQ
jgi:tight adherence protein C